MNIRVYKAEGHWVDVHGVYTWALDDGALVLHSLNPEPVFPHTGIEILAVFAAGEWTYFEKIRS